ncbi:hypothetical protein [Methylorubrum zatmanii]
MSSRPDWHDRARYAAQELGWSQRRIARELGLSLVTVQKLLIPGYGQRQRDDANRRARARYAADPAYRTRKLQRRRAREDSSHGQT